tara:strand:- start:66 stop:614 length:549 start_codon:yes stop_codon:yes gene_type:complete
MEKKVSKKNSKQTLKIVLGVIVVLIILFAINNYFGKDIRLDPGDCNCEGSGTCCPDGSCNCDKPPAVEEEVDITYTCETQNRVFNKECKEYSRGKVYKEYGCSDEKPLRICAEQREDLTCPDNEECYLVVAGRMKDCACVTDCDTTRNYKGRYCPALASAGHRCCPKDPSIDIDTPDTDTPE